MDFFGDESAAAQPAVQATSDPAADFLSGEQSEIANIEGAVYDEPPAQAQASNGTFLYKAFILLSKLIKLMLAFSWSQIYKKEDLRALFFLEFWL